MKTIFIKSGEPKIYSESKFNRYSLTSIERKSYWVPSQIRGEKGERSNKKSLQESINSDRPMWL